MVPSLKNQFRSLEIYKMGCWFHKPLAFKVGDVEAEPFFEGLWEGYRNELSSVCFMTSAHLSEYIQYAASS